VRLILLPIWNAYSFFTLYANADGLRASVRGEGYANVLDRYVIAKTRAMVEATTAACEEYDLTGACAAIRGLLDALNNWYIRRSRPRFWRGGYDRDKQDAHRRLRRCLCRAAAPSHRSSGIAGPTGGRSGAPCRVAGGRGLAADPDLVRDMDRARGCTRAPSACAEGHHHACACAPEPDHRRQGCGAPRPVHLS
jgi:isoleucyl-tRNA synthetase